MDFNYTDSQLSLKKTLADFTRREIEPVEAKIGEIIIKIIDIRLRGSSPALVSPLALLGGLPLSHLLDVLAGKFLNLSKIRNQ